MHLFETNPAYLHFVSFLYTAGPIFSFFSDIPEEYLGWNKLGISTTTLIIPCIQCSSKSNKLLDTQTVTSEIRKLQLWLILITIFPVFFFRKQDDFLRKALHTAQRLNYKHVGGRRMERSWYFSVSSETESQYSTSEESQNPHPSMTSAIVLQPNIKESWKLFRKKATPFKAYLPAIVAIAS